MLEFYIGFNWAEPEPCGTALSTVYGWSGDSRRNSGFFLSYKNGPFSFETTTWIRNVSTNRTGELSVLIWLGLTRLCWCLWLEIKPSSVQAAPPSLCSTKHILSARLLCFSVSLYRLPCSLVEYILTIIIYMCPFPYVTIQSSIYSYMRRVHVPLWIFVYKMNLICTWFLIHVHKRFKYTFFFVTFKPFNDMLLWWLIPVDFFSLGLISFRHKYN